MNKRKEFSKLNLLDRFLFDEAMEDSENMKTVLDSNLLPPGSVDFNKLNRAFIILIMPFYPFGKGFYKYTFRMKCEECPDLDLQDEHTYFSELPWHAILNGITGTDKKLLITWKNSTK